MGGQTMLVVDFGTTFTTAVLAEPGGTRLLDVDSGESKMPSSVFRTPDGQLVCGRMAENQAAVDPSSFEATPKRRFGHDSVLLGGVEVDTVEMIAAVLSRVAEEARRQGNGVLPDEVRLTHPASWREGRRSVLLAAAARAGLGRVTLLPEPIAAAAHYVDRIRATKGTAPPPGAFIAVYDLGGGTFDTAVVRVVPSAPGGLELVGTVGGIDPLGGVDFDHRLLAFVGRSVAANHPEEWERLAGSDEAQWSRARRDALVACRSAKEALSRTPTHTVFVPGVNVDVLVTKDDLEELIRTDVARTIDTLVGVVADAGVTAGKLNGVYLVGGSSRIPLVADMVWDRLKITPTTLEDPKAAVALGGALWRGDAAALRPEPNVRPQPATPPPPPPGPRLVVPPPSAPASAGARAFAGGPAAPPPSGPRPPQPGVPGHDPAPRPIGTPGMRRPNRSFVIAGVAVVLVLLAGLAVAMLRSDDGGGGTPPTTTTTATAAATTAVSTSTGPGSARFLLAGNEELAFGEPHEGDIEDENAVGRYEFEGVEGETVRVVVRSFDVRTFDPKVQVLGPGGELVEENDDISTPNRNSELTVVLEASGAHAIEVVSVSGAGTYELTVEVDELVGDADTPEVVFTDAEQVLHDRIPAGYVERCWPALPSEEDAQATFTCWADDAFDTGVTITLFPSDNTMGRAYAAYGDVLDDTGAVGECPSELPYSLNNDGVTVGRVKCFIQTDGTAFLVQTSACDDQKVLLVVTREDGDFAALFTMWKDGALGPLCL